MSETTQPEALRLAAWLQEGAWHKMKLGDVEAAGRKLRRQHAELETLRAGYAAARLEIESLRARSAEPAGEYPPLPEPLEIDWPELHSHALGCGVEDRGLHNRYECAEYGWQDGVDKCAERVPDQIFDVDQMRAYVDADRAMRAAQPAERQYVSSVKTVADLVNNLQMMDQSLPVYGAQYIEHDGRRRVIAVDPTVSRERVKDERWIGEGEELNAAVIWTRAAQPAQQPGTAYAALPGLFREALAWGMTYGPEIPAHQWDEMRESMVKQYTERASHGQAPAQAAPAAVAGPSDDRVRECAARLVEHADFRLGGILSADSKARDIPSRACSQVKSRHLAALRDALAAAPTTQPAPQQEAQEPVAWMATPVMPSGRGISTVFCSDRSMAEQWDYGGHREYGRMLVTPLYAAPQPSPASKGDALDAARLQGVAQAIRDYHFALDTRQHGGVAQDKAFSTISQAMDMHWVQGAEAAARAAQEGKSHG